MTLEEKLRGLNVYDIDIEDVIEICKEALRLQRLKVANELGRWTEDLSLPNQKRIHEICMSVEEPTWEN